MIFRKKRPSSMRAAAVFATTLCCGLAFAETRSVEKDWEKFQENPRRFMETHPEKTDANGGVVSGPSESSFSRRDILSRKFVGKKLKFRDQITKAKDFSLGDNRFFSGETNGRNKLERFLDRKEFAAKNIQPLFRLDEIEEKGLKTAKLSESPWSGSYWPIYAGILGARYGAQDFRGSGSDWKSYFESVQGDRSLANILNRSNPIEMDGLSPSEKYDIIIGDPLGRPETRRGFLTPRMWAEGRSFMTAYGSVEGWMGICHGWAPASFMTPRPLRSFEARAARDSKIVKFYPDDLKGLTTYLWANSSTETGFLGERCNSKNPKIDPVTGRVIDAECFDVNPGIWHLAVVNHLGQAKRSMIIDATFDYEVWNQPLYSYSFRYFNPETGKKSESYRQALVSRMDYSRDKFKSFRSQNAEAFVGIEMTLSYIAENDPSHEENDSSDRDTIRTVRYLYDLEIDSSGEIIGGEWYTQEHPDFLWLPKADARALSAGDGNLHGSDWDPSQPLPGFWRGIAIATAIQYGQPVGTIIDRLIEKTRE